MLRPLLAAQRGASSASVSPQAALLRQTALWAMTRAASRPVKKPDRAAISHTLE
jgi:hypothetical protein